MADRGAKNREKFRLGLSGSGITHPARRVLDTLTRFGADKSK